MQGGDTPYGKSGMAAPVMDWLTARYGLFAPDVLRRARRTAGAVCVGSVGCAIAVIIALATDQAPFAIPDSLALLALLLCGVSLRAGVSISVVANALIAVGAAALGGVLLATGGASVGFLVAAPLVPAFAMLVGDRRSLLFWSGITIAMIAMVVVLTALEFEFPVRPDLSRVAIGKYFSAILVVGVMSAIGRQLLNDQHRAEQSLLVFQSELERRVEDRTHELQESEEQVGLLLSSTAEAIVGIDLEGNCTFVNPACVQLLGYRGSSDLIGKNVHKLMHHTRVDGTSYPANECKIYQAFREGGGSHVDDEILWRADGSSFPAEYWSYPMFKSGEVIGSVVTFLDISTRRQAEDAVLQSETRLSAILDLAMSAVVCVDREQRISVFNDGAEDIFGYSAEEVLGEHIEMLLPKSFRRVHEKHIKAFARGAGRPRAMGDTRSKVTALRKDGTTFPAAASISMIDVGGEEIFTAVLHDLTEKLRADEELQQAQKMEAVGQLTSGVAHDFNNILTVVMGNLRLAEDAEEKDGDVRKYLSAAFQGAQKGADLNKQLLAFSGRQALDEKITNVGDIARGMLDLLKRTLGEEVEIETIVGAQQCFCNLDPSRLESAILNLAINARDAMPLGGEIRINVMVRHRDENAHAASTEEELVCISVSDNGSGMTEEVKGQALNPFFTTKDVGAGSGLGLSMVHGFVTEAGGVMEIDSEVGKGTTIHMLFPMAIAIDDVPDVAANGEMPRAADGEVVLVVEDQQEVRDVIVTYLGDLGYRVLEAEDGNSGIRILESSDSIDLILSDLVMPGGIRGEVLVAQAKNILPGIKVLYMSGNSLRTASCFYSGEVSAGTLRKPFSKEDLALAVRACLDKVSA